jgi:hypothetical protein
MRFYYISIFSILLLGLIYLIGTGVLTWFGLWLRKRWKRAWMLMVPLFLLLYAGPLAEEFWIAWNFGELCRKDAGLFIYKTVEVDGFYDDTTHWWRQLAESNYQFVESRDNTYGGLWRVERDGKEVRHFKIDRPTARYHFIRDSGRDIGHKVAKQESRLIDTQEGQSVAEYRVYIREPPWFFVGLDRPNMGCDGAADGPNSTHKNSFLIYRDALKPPSRKEEANEHS